MGWSVTNGFNQAKECRKEKPQKGGVRGKAKAHNRTFAKICADSTGQASRLGGQKAKKVAAQGLRDCAAHECEIRIGTSGYHYKHWRGPFYPRKISPDEMLEFYARHFDTVELNNSFYRIPTEAAFDNWRRLTPADFDFAVKDCWRPRRDLNPCYRRESVAERCN
jgi:hypothetical protein